MVKGRYCGSRVGTLLSWRGCYGLLLVGPAVCLCCCVLSLQLSSGWHAALPPERTWPVPEVDKTQQEACDLSLSITQLSIALLHQAGPGSAELPAPQHTLFSCLLLLSYVAQCLVVVKY